MNSEELLKFFQEANDNGDPCIAQKGCPPDDAVYSDGEKVIEEITVAWFNTVTGASCQLQFAKVH